MPLAVHVAAYFTHKALPRMLSYFLLMIFRMGPGKSLFPSRFYVNCVRYLLAVLLTGISRRDV